MYAYIKGELVKCEEEYIVVENNGIGYLINIPFNLSVKLGSVGSDVKVYLYQNVREDEISLFGFATEAEKNIFEMLLTVSGIGPKVAHSICSQIEPDKLAVAVINSDINLLTKVKGLGKKGAERIVVELKDKLKKQGRGSAAVSSSGSGAVLSVINAASDTSIINDAIDALVVLGYKQNTAEETVAQVYNSDMTLERLITASLKSLSKF
ncbi:MAG: Holliday junction branch migration protein RuvA [Clostridia bacterium]|nr:Holliday junction branch migration protein RuvA [Clostridia bacterium]